MEAKADTPGESSDKSCLFFTGRHDPPSPLPAFGALLGTTPAPLSKRFLRGLSVATAPLRHSRCKAEAAPGWGCYFSPPRRQAGSRPGSEPRRGCGRHLSGPGRAGPSRTRTWGWGRPRGVLPRPRHPTPASPPIQTLAVWCNGGQPPASGQKSPVPLAGWLGQEGPPAGGPLVCVPRLPPGGPAERRRATPLRDLHRSLPRGEMGG